MEFFVRHYEKLLLAICLIGLCFAIWQVNENKKLNLAEAKEQKMTATEKAQVKGEKAVPPLDVSKLPTFDAIINSQQSYSVDKDKPARVISENQLALTHVPLAKDAPAPFTPQKDAAAPGLLDIGRLVFCQRCSHVIPFSAEIKEGYKCPYCNEPIADVARATTPEDDLDQDGIPDLFEQDHVKLVGQNGGAAAGGNNTSRLLNYRWPHDALMDFDGDGFLNIEEYEYFTKELKVKSDEAAPCLSDSAEHPPLARLLFRTTTKERHDTLPFTLYRVKPGQALFLPTSRGRVITARAGKKDRVPTERAAGVRFGKDNKPVTIPMGGGRYQLISVNVANGTAVIQQRDDADIKYTLHIPKNEKDPGSYEIIQDDRPILEFLFLDNRNAEALASPRRLTERQIQSRWKEANNSTTENPGNMAAEEAPAPTPSPRRTPLRRRNGPDMPDDGGMAPGGDTTISGPPVAVFSIHIGKDGTVITLQKQAVAEGGQGGTGGVDTEFYRITGNDKDGILAQELENNNGTPGSPVGDPIKIPVFDKEKVRYLYVERANAEAPMR